jgi:hypothetical protein
MKSQLMYSLEGSCSSVLSLLASLSSCLSNQLFSFYLPWHILLSCFLQFAHAQNSTSPSTRSIVIRALETFSFSVWGRVFIDIMAEDTERNGSDTVWWRISDAEWCHQLEHVTAPHARQPACFGASHVVPRVSTIIDHVQH